MARHLAAGWLALFMCAWSADVIADESPAPANQAPKSTRTAIKVLVLGERGQQMQPALEALINSELRDSNAQLSFESQAGRVRSWVERARHDEGTLLLAVVDTRKDLSWRVYIVDAERGRAAARSLPGGVEQDQAAVEAAASIIVSASAALREGLEVASKPVDEVVAPEEEAPEPEPEPEPAPRPPPVRTPPEKVQPPPPAPPSPRSQAPGFHFRAGLLASAAAFAKPERASFGGALSLGVSSPGNWVLRAGVGRDLPITIASDYGEFAIQRSTASLSFGHVVSVRRFELELKAGAAGELVERGQPEAVDTATARGERSYTRAGGLVGLQARYRVLGPLAVELGLGASYFARRVRFVSAPEGGEIAQLWKIVPKVELGIELRLP